MIKLKDLLLAESPDSFYISPASDKKITWYAGSSVCFGVKKGVVFYKTYKEAGDDSSHLDLKNDILKVAKYLGPLDIKNLSQISEVEIPLQKRSTHIFNATTSKMKNIMQTALGWTFEQGGRAVFDISGRLWLDYPMCSFWNPQADNSALASVIFKFIRKLGKDYKKYYYESTDSPLSYENHQPIFSNFAEFQSNTRPKGGAAPTVDSILDLAKKSRSDLQAAYLLRSLVNTPGGYESAKKIATDQHFTNVWDWLKKVTGEAV